MKEELKSLSKERLKELYHKDFPLWAEINLQLLKEKAYELVDWENLLEEIEDMARSDLKACISYLAVILEHLYKWDKLRHLTWAGGEGGHSWVASVYRARERLKAYLENSPSLRSKIPQEIDKAWNFALAELRGWLEELHIKGELKKGELEKLLTSLPNKCPYTYEEAMNRDLRKELKDEGRA